ncbi:chromosome partitioning protein ParA [Vibrio maritimus]|uniref:UPF0325 protein YaeH n=1 Tax=Vibrio maritimus TaxID=990268 RepID=A0A090S2I1_9VIBR|nr:MULTISPECIES: hypothetical protein [Vibrio]USD61115.1 chromosome partitioning protein ParA [Vibrio sp. SCSIO 43140]GAL21771.1 UPF0325 protein YaeH [Vibrio maritimus]
MVSINGLPSIPNQRKTQKANAKKAVSKASTSQSSQSTSQSTQVTKVAQAVAHSVKHLSDADMAKAQVQYDLPEGRSKKALEEYMNVMNRAKREELEQLLGVDIYI